MKEFGPTCQCRRRKTAAPDQIVMLSEVIMKFKDRINSARVTDSELIEATRAFHELPEKDRDFEGRSILLVQMFRGDPDKVMAIDSRLRALAVIVESGKLPGWSTPVQEDGSSLLAQPVWQAAATVPLIFNSDFRNVK